jgi:hypothetical protein
VYLHHSRVSTHFLHNISDRPIIPIFLPDVGGSLTYSCKYHEHRSYQIRGFRNPTDTPVNEPEGLNL